jgi:hypothetical protein
MDDDIIHFRLTATSLRQLREFAERTGADLGCRGIAKRTPRGFSLSAYLPRVAYEEARAEGRTGISIAFVENFTEVSRARRAEVSSVNRYAARGAVPQGLGLKE